MTMSFQKLLDYDYHVPTHVGSVFGLSNPINSDSDSDDANAYTTNKRRTRQPSTLFTGCSLLQKKNEREEVEN